MAVDIVAGKGWYSTNSGASWGRNGTGNPATGANPDFFWTPGSGSGSFYFAMTLNSDVTQSPVVRLPTTNSATLPSGFTSINA
jgi:hypothetical protein